MTDIFSTTVPTALIQELAALHGVSPADGKDAVKAAIAYKQSREQASMEDVKHIVLAALARYEHG